jgi:phosphate transport system permease protein
MPDAQARARRRKVRTIQDGISRYGIGAAGMAVIGALGLLLSLFRSSTAAAQCFGDGYRKLSISCFQCD